MKKIIRLSERNLHNMIKESVIRLIRETEMLDDYYDYDDYEDYEGETHFKWEIYFEDELLASSSQLFTDEDEAVADCESHFDETNFYALCKEYNENPRDISEEEKVVALITCCGPNGECPDTCLQNYGFGWMD